MEWPSRAQRPLDARARYRPQHRVGIGGHPLGEGAPCGDVVPPTGLEVIRQVQHATDGLPLGMSERVVAHRGEYASVGLAVGGSTVGRSGAVAEGVEVSYNFV